MIGLQGTAYFGGFIAGCVLGPGLIKNVGHIRAFAGVVAILAALILLFPIWVQAHAWIGLRLLSGACLAVTFMSLEPKFTNQVQHRYGPALQSSTVARLRHFRTVFG